MSKKKRINYKKFIPFCLVVLLIISSLVWIIVKKPFKKCEHVHGEDGYCTICGEPSPHNFKDGYCTICGVVDPDYVFPDEIIDLSIACGGDVMAHLTNLQSAFNDDAPATVGSSSITTDGTFDFTDNYKYVSEYISSADIAFVNLETTFSGGNKFSGSPGSFNAPDSLADALKGAGFDAVFTCNNHSLDYGKIDGLKRTIDVLREKGFTVIGSRKDTEENRSAIIDVKGVKIGVAAYTYETRTVNGKRTLNGSTMPDGAWNFLNTYRYASINGKNVAIDEDKLAIAQEIKWCRDNGADVIVAYFHWDATNEYVLEPTSIQKDLASYAAESGADIIFGSHPHRVQTIEILDVNGKQVPVFYSLGNFISNQRYESLITYGDPEDRARATEEELLAYVEISYNKTQSTLEIKKISAIPLWVDRYKQDGKTEYRIYPLVGDYQNNEDLVYSKHGFRAADALKNITNIIGEQYIYTK